MSHIIGSTFIAGLALSALALWVTFDASVAEANGQTVSILETTQGPYNIDVRISPPSPRVGNLHLSIALHTADGGEPITDAAVSVSAVGPGPESIEVGPLSTYTTPPTLNLYELNVALAQEGEWRFTMGVARGEDLTELEFPLSVSYARVNWWVIIVLISAIPLLIAAAWYLRQSTRRGPTGLGA